MADDALARIAAYRWQLGPGRGFGEAAEALPTIAALGVSHLYLSPVAEAVPGSTHGYDVTDPTRLREELGGADGFAVLAAACRRAGVRLLIDIVPNHLAAHAENPWWWDLLRFGPASKFAEVFDIDWRSADALVLPVLGDHYGRELEAGRLSITRHAGGGGLLEVRYADLRFPVRPEAEGAVLAAVARDAEDDLLGVAARLLARSEQPVPDPGERDADLAVAHRTASARLAEPPLAAALDAELRAINGDVERLDLLLARQHHRLARWTVGDAEVDYRRFFDVDSLAATRMDGPLTFDLLHRLPAELLDLDVVDGLRVDHVDGLADPARYLTALRELGGPSAWLLVEKIVRRDEELPAWPVAGTTGYEVADLLGGWLTDPAGADAIVAGWRDRTGEQGTYREAALAARREVLAAGFAADLGRVVEALAAVCLGRRRHRDHTRASLRAAVTELAVHTPRYRTYAAPGADGGTAISDEERAVVVAAAAAAREARPELDPELLDLLVAVLTGGLTGPDEAQVVTRFQQLTGPVAAKGEEDTALYRWLPLPHRCEVGADPGVPTTSTTEWHEACAVAQERWPERLTTLSTHDTKRSADARARLAALTVRPDALLAAFDRWIAAVGDGEVDPGSAWLVFHALLAAWPLELDRAVTAVEKSLREAGLRTSWTQPDETFEAAVRSLLERALAVAGARQIVDELVDGSADRADVAALSQLLAQLVAPGIPDLYQGAEAWDRSLVDPDNRRPPSLEVAADLVERSRSTPAADAWADESLRRSGLPRTIVLRAALEARRRHGAAVGPGPAGAYRPLGVEGPDADRVLAFARGADPTLVVVVARPGDDVADASVRLPDGDWRDCCTGAGRRGTEALADLHAAFPVALLER